MSGNPAQKTYLVPTSKDGTLVARSLSVTNTGVVVKASPGKVFVIHAHNINASVRYLKIYNKATTPTDSDTPIMTLPLATGFNRFDFTNLGVQFSAGISYRASTELADNGNTAPSANETILHLTYV
jgi:hypothetical protein